jgi:hypothetical protein
MSVSVAFEVIVSVKLTDAYMRFSEGGKEAMISSDDAPSGARY